MNPNLLEYPEANIIFSAEENYFDDFYKRHNISNTGGLNDLDYRDLYELCGGVNKYNIYQSNIKIAEIGCYLGRTTIFLAYLFKEIKGGLYGIDWFKPSSIYSSIELKNMINNNIKIFGVTNIKIIEGESTEVSKQFSDDYFDFIFIDASHGYEDVKNDINTWYPKTKNNGIISGHDFESDGVVKAVIEKFGSSFKCTKHERIWYHKKEE